MTTSPHSQRKGCGICNPHKHGGNGQAVRKPLPELRRLGRARRVRRHEIGDEA